MRTLEDQTDSALCGAIRLGLVRRSVRVAPTHGASSAAQLMGVVRVKTMSRGRSYGLVRSATQSRARNEPVRASIKHNKGVAVVIMADISSRMVTR